MWTNIFNAVPKGKTAAYQKRGSRSVGKALRFTTTVKVVRTATTNTLLPFTAELAGNNPCETIVDTSKAVKVVEHD